MPNKTASETYMKRYRKINTLLGNLKWNIEAHKKTQKLRSKSWGFAGDLSHVIEELENLNKFFEKSINE